MRWIPGSIAAGEADPCDGYPDPSRPAGLTRAMDTRIHRGKRVWIRVSIALPGRAGQMNSRIHRTRTSRPQPDRPSAAGPAIRSRTSRPQPDRPSALGPAALASTAGRTDPGWPGG